MLKQAVLVLVLRVPNLASTPMSCAAA